MLKSKDKRDTILFVFMTVIIILFLVYLFVPLSDKSSTPDLPSKTASKPDASTENPGGLSLSLKKKDEGCEFAEFNEALEGELGRVLAQVLDSPDPFADHPVEALEKILAGGSEGAETGNGGGKSEAFFELLGKCSRLGFYDLSDIRRTVFPRGCS